MSDGGFLFIHFQKSHCLLEVKANGDATITIGEVVYQVDRSAGEVLDMAPASLRVVDEWLTRHRSPQWVRAEVQDADWYQGFDNYVSEKQKKKIRKAARKLAIKEWCEQIDESLRQKYGTIAGIKGIYGRPPYLSAGPGLAYDKETGEIFEIPERFKKCDKSCGSISSENSEISTRREGEA